MTEYQLRQSLHDKADRALTRSHEKWVAPEIPLVTAKVVDITDEEQFPEIARAIRYAKEKGLS